ncbi:hypothetical protein Cci01nite_71560 [Catellatospora citrea]|uniref:Uncharacterized protein n=1 Tax=Catellatospora citrea TaxID=53366 RepID=A0A8J3KFP0_9ACTN|nr:hypothetical protein Cci01nite_71560 [Catellatospora citrea]
MLTAPAEARPLPGCWERHAAVRRLVNGGLQRQVIASRLGLHPAPSPATPMPPAWNNSSPAWPPVTPRPSKDYLGARWNAGCTDATRLTEELRDHGYKGSSRTVRP